MKASIFLVLATALLLTPLAALPEEDHDAGEREALRKEMAEARRELAEAARRVADIGRELGAEAGENIAFRFLAPGAPRAMLGIAIADAGGEDEPDGVEVLSVTPGGPADQSGIQAGDIVTAIITEAGETALADVDAPADALVDAVHGLEAGDTVELRYRRGDDERSADVTLETIEPFRFMFGDVDHVPFAPLPRLPAFLDLMHGWGELELAPISETLGEYFGTDKGLLVVRAPDDEKFELRDGDVILAIGGREPEDPGHAMRILGSYRPGETLVLDVLRKGERMELEVEVPERRRSGIPRRAREWFSRDHQS
ncbi:MAG TPA: PDZ domain-containing protein [Gammaproteobacteria bacterium]